MWGNTTTDRLQFLAGIKKGELKNDFGKIINKNLTDEEREYFNIKNISDLNTFTKKPNSNVILSDSEMSTLFDPERIAKNAKTKNFINDLIFTQPNHANIQKLRSFAKEHAENNYLTMNYAKEMLDSLFVYIDENKLSLEAFHEQVHVGNNSIEKYHLKNSESKNLGLEENMMLSKFNTMVLNPKYFSFYIEIKINTKTKIKNISLNEVYLNGQSYAFGSISLEDVTKLLGIVQQIYSDTKIKPLSETNPVEVKEIKISRRQRIVSPDKREDIFEDKKKSYKKLKKVK